MKESKVPLAVAGTTARGEFHPPVQASEPT